MKHPLFEFFGRDLQRIPKDRSEWPESWKNIEYKTYPRLKRIKLPTPNLGGALLKDAISNRMSDRNFSSNAVGLSGLSSVLYFGAGITNPGSEPRYHKRAYPSGGALYPIETYFAALNVEGIERGIYHYNILDHAVEFLVHTDAAEFGEIFPAYDFIKNSAATFIFTMVQGRSVPKYGNLAYKLALIEAGHIVENMYLTASALRMKCCSIGEIANEKLANELLDIDGIDESAFYMLVLGS